MPAPDSKPQPKNPGPIQPGEVVGRLKAVQLGPTGSSNVLVECLVCRRQGWMPRWKFRRPVEGATRACDECLKAEIPPQPRQVTITKRMHEALTYIGEARLPLSSVQSGFGGRTLAALVRLGATSHASGIVQNTNLGLDILTLTPRWSPTRNGKGEDVAIWGFMLNPDGTVSHFSSTRPRKAGRKALPDTAAPVLDRDLSRWIEPTTEAERLLLWEQLHTWEKGADFPALHPLLVARLVKDVDRLHAIVKGREKLD